MGLKPFYLPRKARYVIQEFNNITELRAMSQCEIPESRQFQGSLSPYQLSQVPHLNTSARDKH